MKQISSLDEARERQNERDELTRLRAQLDEKQQQIDQLEDELTHEKEQIVRLRRKIKEITIYNPQTKLLNKEGFELFGKTALDNLRRNKTTGFSTVIIDFNEFKKVNDDIGHFTTDDVMLVAIKRMRNVLRRSNDHLARLGGDEFGALIYGDREHAVWVVQQLKEVFKDPINLDRTIKDVDLTFSAGIVYVSADTELKDFKEIMHKADMEMYRQKRERRKQER